jgi:pyridinium-3,5-biscarboxylic acid mononucleotide synthase
LASRVPELDAADVIIAVAGFEAALVSVVAGLFPQPVIGVPTSIGYGVAAGGRAALGSMLASCANGVVVVNIDNGYGAAVAAYRMLTLQGKR